MIRNYFIVAWRNLVKDKLISFINISGLTLGISVCLLISLFIYDELSYDTFGNNYEQVYRLESTFKSETKTTNWAATPFPMKRFLERTCPEVESAARLYNEKLTTILADNKKFGEEYCYWADPSVFTVLGLDLLQGQESEALTDPNAVVISENTASKYFGKADAMGKIISVNGHPMKVTGVFRDFPVNSHIHIDLMPSLNFIYNTKPDYFDSDWGSSFYTYVRLKPNTNVLDLRHLLPARFEADGFPYKEEQFNFRFHPVSRIHLDGNIEKEVAQNSQRIFIYIFSSIGLVILILASINYINLSTSRSMGRSREIGVRKTLGASRSVIIAQFLTESFVTTLFSFVLAILLIWFALPYFNSITGKSFSLSSLPLPFFAGTSATIIIFISIMAGLYPAFIVSSFDPVSILRSGKQGRQESYFSMNLKKSLLVFQFVITIFLLIASQFVIRQMDYIFNKPLGYDRENVLIVPINSFSEDKFHRFKETLSRYPSIVNVSAASSVPGKRIIFMGVKYGDAPGDSKRAMSVEKDYIKTMHMKIMQGRDFDSRMVTDSTSGFIINESVMKLTGWKEPLGKPVSIMYGNDMRRGSVIGVVQDFHQGSLHSPVEPVVLFMGPAFCKYLVVKFKEDHAAEAARLARTAWESSFSDQAFSFTYLEDEIKTLYAREYTLKKVLFLFTLFAMMIALMGLFGLIHYSATLRKKEIGIRKILGAAAAQVVYLLSKEYILLICVAVIIAIPLSAYLLHAWLMNFAYRMDFSIYPFIIAGALTLAVALATLVIQSLKALRENPVKNLRAE
jgi:putative ABC transport system permease protein